MVILILDQIFWVRNDPESSSEGSAVSKTHLRCSFKDKRSTNGEKEDRKLGKHDTLPGGATGGGGGHMTGLSASPGLPRRLQGAVLGLLLFEHLGGDEAEIPGKNKTLSSVFV